MYQGNCLELMKQIEDNSVDLVLTDPPYGIDKEGIENDHSLEAYYSSLPEIYRVLKSGSFFVTFTSIGRLPEFFNNNPFDYRWMFIQYINNGMVRGSIGFNRYICVLIFQKGEAKITKPMQDVYEMSTSSQECAKREHPTQKDINVVRRLIETFSKPNDIVLDPFAGSGTTLIASKQIDRRYIGIEINQQYVDVCNRRLQQRRLMGGLLSSYEESIILVKRESSVDSQNSPPIHNKKLEEANFS